MIGITTGGTGVTVGVTGVAVGMAAFTVSVDVADPPQQARSTSADLSCSAWSQASPSFSYGPTCVVQAYRPAGRIEHFEKPFKCRHRLEVGRPVPESLAHQLSGLENRLPLPGLQRIDPENA